MEIRRYTPEDTPKLLHLIRTVYNEEIYKIAVQRFQWQYEQNPNNSSEDPLILVLEDDNKIVGMTGAFAQKLKIGDTNYPAYWVGDFMVHPDFRGNRNGLNLAKQMAHQPFLLMGFNLGNVTNLWVRAGVTIFIQLVEYSRIIWCFDPLIDYLCHQNPKEIKIIDVKYFDERFDQLWEKVSKAYRVIQVRDSRFLNWRFFNCPHLAYRVLAAVKNNEILGYIVIRDAIINRIHEGNIIDLFVDRSDNIVTKLLMNAGVKVLKNNGCNVIKMVVSADDKFLNEALRQCFFLSCKKRERGIFSNNISNDLNSIIKDPGNWFLTKADSDIDFS